jgi:hypothetical protein
MVIHNLDSNRPVIGPNETDPVPVVDTDTELPDPLSSERFKTISGRHAQVAEAACRIELLKLSGGYPLKIFWATPPCSLGVAPVEDVFGSLTFESADHQRMIARLPCYKNSFVGMLTLQLTTTRPRGSVDPRKNTAGGKFEIIR